MQLPHGLDHVIGNLPLGHSHTADQLIDENTLLPLFAPFIDSTRYQEVKSDMRGGGGVAVRSRLGLNSGIRSPNWLRHCSVCDTGNRDRFGETFWARLHQTSGVNICPVHRCFLEQTSVTRLSSGVFSAISAESVCRNTTPHDLDESGPNQVIQFNVARDAAWLLDINHRKPGPMALSKSYLFCAVNQGFATYSGKYKQLNLHSAFTDRYDKELLRLLCLEFAEGKKPWLRRFFVAPAEIQYPIRHLVVMHFLGFTVAEFFDQLPEEEAQVEPKVQRQKTDYIDAPSLGGEAFGTAPWPCRNPVSDCGGKLLIQECAERTTRGRTNYGKVIGDFVCPHCGFTFSRLGPSEGDSKRMVWIRDYGFTWKAELQRVWVDHRYNNAQAASHLGVTAMVVRTQASLCGLVVPKPGQRMSQRAKDCRLRRRGTARMTTVSHRYPLASQRERFRAGTRPSEGQLPQRLTGEAPRPCFRTSLHHPAHETIR